MRNKGYLLFGLLSILGSCLLFDYEVLAVDNQETDLGIGFVSGDGGGITNPLVPGEVIEPKEGAESGVADGLKIDYVGMLDFGTQTIPATDAYFSAGNVQLKNDTYVPQFIQISDTGGHLAGWSVSVTMSEFETNDKKQKIDGVQLALKNMEVVPGISNYDLSYAPTVAATEVTLVPNTSQRIFSAADKKGAGSWIVRFGSSETAISDSISLLIPKKSTKLAEEYSASLLWTITNEPT